MPETAPMPDAAPLVVPLPEQAHTIVPIWTFALFLLAYLAVSVVIRARYRARRRMIEEVMVEVERKRGSGEELHWPQPRPKKGRESFDEKGNPVTPPKDPGDGDDTDVTSPSKNGKGGRGKKKKGGRNSALQRSLSDPDSSSAQTSWDPDSSTAGEDGGRSSGVTFEMEESPRGPGSMDDDDEDAGAEGSSAAETGTTFDVEDVPERGKTKKGGGKGDTLKGVGKGVGQSAKGVGKGVGKSAKGVGKSAQKKKDSLKAKVSEVSEGRGSGGNGSELRASQFGSGSADSNVLVRTVTAMDMGPGAAPDDEEENHVIEDEILNEREEEARLPAFQRFMRHMSGNLEGLLLIQEFGVEAGFYLAVLWLFSRFLFCVSFLGLPLAAFYYKFGERQNLDLSCFTAANLKEGSTETWMTVAASCILLMSSQACGVYVWSRLRKLKYATKEAKKEALYGSTLMIDGLPIDITDDEMLFEHLNTVVPSWIKTAHIALDLEALIRIERALAAARHEHARAVNNMGTCSGSGRVRKAEKAVDRLTREEEQMRTTELKGTGIAFLTFRSLHRAMEFKRAISARQFPDSAPSPTRLGEASDDSNPSTPNSADGKSEPEPEPESGPPPTEEELESAAAATGEADEWASIEADQGGDAAFGGRGSGRSSSPNRHQENSTSKSPRAPDGTEHPLAADAGVLNLFGWKLDVAPDPSDILWENLRISPESRKRRRRSTLIILAAILLFGSALVLLGVFFLGFYYVDLVYDIEPGAHVAEGLSQVGEGLAEVFGGAYWLVFLAPPAFFLGLIASVPMIAKKLLAIEKHFVRSAVMQSYVTKSFAFYLLLNLVLTSCSWTVIVTQSETDGIGQIEQNCTAADLLEDAAECQAQGRMSKMRIFADLSGTFHICVVLTEAFIMVPFRMYRGWNLEGGINIVALGTWSFMSPALPFNPTLRADEMDDDAVLLFDFSKQYAEIFSILAMVLAYGPLLPFVLPAGWLYFEILLVTDRQVLRQQFAKHRTEDKRIRTITTHIQWAALAAQFVPFVFIAVHGTQGGMIALCVFALWMLIAYAAYIDRADNHGKLFYNKIERCIPCAKTSKSARAQVGFSYTGSLDARADDGSPKYQGSTDGLYDGDDQPSRDFAKLSLQRTVSEKQKGKGGKNKGKTNKDTAAEAAANPLADDDLRIIATGDANSLGYDTPDDDDGEAGGVESPYNHPLKRAVSGDYRGALAAERASPSFEGGTGGTPPQMAPANFGDLDDMEAGAFGAVERPTPLVLDNDSGLGSNGNGSTENGSGVKQAKKDAASKRKLEKEAAKLGKKQRQAEEKRVKAEAKAEKKAESEPEPEPKPVPMAAATGMVKAKGGFGKRGQGLKPTKSDKYAHQNSEANKAEAFHLGGTTGSLEDIQKTTGPSVGAADVDRTASHDERANAAEGSDFSMFDDILAGASVGGNPIQRLDSDDL